MTVKKRVSVKKTAAKKKAAKSASTAKARTKPKAEPKPKALAKLSAKQQQFVVEYFANDLNATKAAIAAGYAPAHADTQGSRLMANPAIAAVIAQQMKDKLDKREITAERVLDEIAKVAFLDPRKLWNADGGLRPVHELGDGEAAAIAGIEVTELYQDKWPIGRLKKIKIADKLRALEALGRYLKLFTDKVEHSGSLGVQLITTVPRPQRGVSKEK